MTPSRLVKVRLTVILLALLAFAPVLPAQVTASVRAVVTPDGRGVSMYISGGGDCGPSTFVDGFDGPPGASQSPLCWETCTDNGPWGWGIQCLSQGSHTFNIIVFGGVLQPDGSCAGGSAPASTSFTVTRNGSIHCIGLGLNGYLNNNPGLAVVCDWNLFACVSDYVHFTTLPTDQNSAGGVGNYSVGDYGSFTTATNSIGGADFVQAAVGGCNEDQDRTIIPAPYADNRCDNPGCQGCCGQPIKSGNGNMRAHDREPLPGGLERTYDSNRVYQSRTFGPGWSSPFDAWFRTFTSSDGSQWQSVGTTSGDRTVFRNFVQIFPPGPKPASLSYDANSGLYAYREYGADTVTYLRSSDGTIAKTRSLSTGRETLYTFAGGLPTQVTDSWGNWTWDVTTTAGRITAIAVEGTPLTWNYLYDGAGHLSSVNVNGNVWRTYTNAGMDGRMTQSTDAAGNLIEAHTYDGSSGVALSSTSNAGDDVQNVTYSGGSGRPYTMNGLALNEDVTTVSWASGATTIYSHRFVAGRRLLVQVDGGCVSCGAKNATWAFDPNGNPVREQDGRGYILVKTFGAGGQIVSTSGPYKPSGCDPETDPGHCRLDPDSLAIAALTGTSATKTTNYVYGDANWYDRPTSISTDSVAAPGQTAVESLVYDAVTGAVVSDSVSGYSGYSGSPATQQQRTTATALYNGTEGAAFDPGSVFSSGWTTLPQPAGLRKSVDGPRTDVSDVTLYVYYPLDASVPALLRGHIAATRNAAGHVAQFASYDVFGNVTRVVDPNGVATESSYDSLGRLLTSTVKGVAGCDTSADPLCATDLTSTRSYTPAAGPLASEQRPNGGVTSYTYDSRGRVATISRGPSAGSMVERITYSYDPASGNKSSEVTAGFQNGSWVTTKSESYTYNSDALLSSVVHPDNTTINYAYGADGILASVKDENHTSPNTSYAYDPAGRLATVVQTLSTSSGGQITTTYSYDIQGHLVSVTDPNGNVTTYVYDDFGQMLQQNSPVSGTTTYSYDSGGNLLSTTDANGSTTTRTYDAINRVTASTSTGLAGTESVTTTYDDPTSGNYGIGRMATMTDPTGSTAYAYERRGMLRGETKTIQGSPYTTLFQYDADGNRGSMTYPSGMVVKTTFDFAGRPASAAAGSTTIVSSAAYLPFGPMKQLFFGNGTTKTMAFDLRYRPLENKLTGPSGTLLDYVYAEDNAGNITQIHDAVDATWNRDFGYDDLNRLTTANSGSSLWKTGSYTYDGMGNMLSANLGGWKSLTSTLAGTTPKLSNVVENGLARGVSYDAAGNELSAGSASYSYSPANHLATSEGRAYLYDGRGVPTIASIPLDLASVSIAAPLVRGGTSTTGSVTLTGAAPSNVTILLSSSGAAAGVPASVLIPAGAASASFTVTTTAVTADTPVEITATLGATSRRAALVVDPAEVATVAASPSTVTNGNGATGTVTLDSTALVDTIVTLTSTPADSQVQFPSSVTIRAGTSSASFSITTSLTGNTPVTKTIAASYDSITRQTSFTVNPATLTAVAVAPVGPVGGTAPATATATLNGNATPGGTTVTFTSSNTNVVATPKSASISAGGTSGQAQVLMAPVGSQTPVTVSGTDSGGNVRSTVVTVQPAPVTIAAISVSPTSVVATNPATGTVSLTGAAPTGGIEVDLAGTANVVVPPFVTVPAGSWTATFPIATLINFNVSSIAMISGYQSVNWRSTNLTVSWPAASPYLSSLQVTPSLMNGGTMATGTINLSAPVTAGGGVAVALTSSNPSVVSVPSKITVKKGLQSQTFSVTTFSVTSPKSVTITASANSVMQQATLTILPSGGVVVASIDNVPPGVRSGAAPTVASVTLTGPAPAGGAVVTMGGSRTNIVTISPTVTIPPGATSGTFTITALPFVGSNHYTIITATYNGITQSSAVMGIDAELTSRVTSEHGVLCASASLAPCLTASAIRQAANDASTPSRYYLYTPELSLLAETESSTAASKAMAYSWITFGGTPVAMLENATNTTRWIATDHLGSPLAMTDTSGSIAWRAEYTPYGETYTVRTGSTIHQPLRFPGQFAEDGSELAENVFRFYRAGWGRYTQGDFIGLSAGLNLYAYVKENPVVVADPMGMDAVQYIGEPNRKIQIDCKSADALGCTTFDAHGDCKCSPGCDRATHRNVWAANTALQIGPIRLYFSTDCYDTGKIIMEEERHVSVYQDAIREAREREAQLNGKMFNSREECQSACQDFVRDVGSILQQAARNWWIDFTHPVKRCDGTTRWY